VVEHKGSTRKVGNRRVAPGVSANGFVRSDREYITHSMAKKVAEELNFSFGIKAKAKGAS